MKTLGIKLMGMIAQLQVQRQRLFYLEALLLFGALLTLWKSGNSWMQHNMPLAGTLDPNIWLLILLSIITFLLLNGLCWLMLQRISSSLGLPALATLVSQFKTLTLWQQFASYYFFFALLLFSAIGCLSAIC